MPRIRTIKPEFWADEKLAPLDPLTRLVFLGLVSLADDCGRHVDNVKQIDAKLFPLTDDTCKRSLAKLAETGRIDRGLTASGQPVIQIANWRRHQKIDNPSFKACVPEIAKNTGDSPHSPDPSETLARVSRDPSDSTYDQRSTTDEQRPTNDKAPGGAACASPSDGTETRFKAFWDAYIPFDMPKGSKATARERFNKLSAADQAKLADAARRYCAECANFKTKTKHAECFIYDHKEKTAKWRGYLEDGDVSVGFVDPALRLFGR